MAKQSLTGVVRAVTAVVALAPALLLYSTGRLTAPSLSTRWLSEWVHEPLSPEFLVVLGEACAWLLWALLVSAVVNHIHRHVAARIRCQFDLRLPGPVQALAATVLGSTAVATAALPAAAQESAATGASLLPLTPLQADQGTPVHHEEPAAWTPSRTSSNSPEIVMSAAALATPLDRDRPGGRSAAHARRAPNGAVRVVAGDTLWDLAADHLGDPNRWPEIYKLNRGHKQANGYALTDPDMIHTGWILTLPGSDTKPAAAPHRTQKPPSGSSGHTAPSGSKTAPGAPTPATGTPTPSAQAPRATEPSPPANSADVTTPAPNTAPSQHQAGIAVPPQGWISLGLAAAIATVATLLRLQRRRRARLTFPAPTSTATQPAPTPPRRAAVDNIGSRYLGSSGGAHHLASPAVAAPIGVDSEGTEVSLFQLPGPGVALHGDGAVPAARAVLASVLTSDVLDSATSRPVVVTTADLLARLLPEDAPAVGLDPDGTSYDGERLLVLADTAAAVTHAEEETVGRCRLLETFNAETITDLNTRTDHAETQPPYVLLIDANPPHGARLQAVATHRTALDLHPVILGPQDGIPTIDITADGTASSDEPHTVVRFSTLSADDLAAILTMLTETTARPEPGTDVDERPTENPAAAISAEAAEPVPAQPCQTATLVRLRVLGPVTVATDAGPITTGMRSGSYLILAVLAAHPAGRTLDQLAAALHPDVDPAAAVNRVRTDITSARRVLRTASGHDEPMFIVYDPATGRYQLDPQTVSVDLWQMLTAINEALNSDDEAATLAALRRATGLYGGDFAEGHDYTWAADHATSYRHQVLTAYARIAEIVEADHPDQALAALEGAAELEPVNEELYQRIMRIHGRQHRPDAVRRTLRRLEDRLADLGGAEPSQATRRIAERQFRPAAPVPGGRP
ncbi:BTAD domain-containing putative transcriptional regulator [Plantactinospora siamensis]|uniref:BTAD domain-containing putative transcriptional regulator n=1 Tax=Plantactinospora siamensis TaxID=555372 RepID=A0ABV6NUH6_9ACTN